MPGTGGKAAGIGAVIIRFVAVQKSGQKAGLGVIMVQYMIPFFGLVFPRFTQQSCDFDVNWLALLGLESEWVLWLLRSGMHQFPMMTIRRHCCLPSFAGCDLPLTAGFSF